LDAAFGLTYDDPVTLKVWFSADQARYVKERQWAAEQSFDDQADGSTVLSMKTSGWYEVKRWILSFGRDAKLLEPVNLKQDILEETLSMANAYQPCQVDLGGQ
jgi:predicted DNA-binding transcriptional regulator YafY